MKSRILAYTVLAAALLTGPSLVVPLSSAHAADAPGYDNAGPKKGAELTEQQRDAIHKAFSELRDKNYPLTSQVRELKYQQHKLLMAQTFDQKAFLDLDHQIAEKRDQMRQNRETTFATLAASLPPDARMHIYFHLMKKHGHHQEADNHQHHGGHQQG